MVSYFKNWSSKKTENGNSKDFDFEIQAEEAHKAEAKLRELLLAKDGTFELKTERGQWHDTGNIVIEYESHQKPSGIAATKANYWIHELRSKEDKTLVYLMFPTPVLKKICNNMIDKSAPCRRGGEGKQMEMMLLSLEKLFSQLQHFSGTGDENFISPKEKSTTVENTAKK